MNKTVIEIIDLKGLRIEAKIAVIRIRRSVTTDGTTTEIISEVRIERIEDHVDLLSPGLPGRKAEVSRMNTTALLEISILVKKRRGQTGTANQLMALVIILLRKIS